MTNLRMIVVPYYELHYLDAALGSLARGPLGRFKGFIGDDASPEDPPPRSGKI
jgi:hypothetical protein